jgi:hypothetical protein
MYVKHQQIQDISFDSSEEDFNISLAFILLQTFRINWYANHQYAMHRLESYEKVKSRSL